MSTTSRLVWVYVGIAVANVAAGSVIGWLYADDKAEIEQMRVTARAAWVADLEAFAAALQTLQRCALGEDRAPDGAPWYDVMREYALEDPTRVEAIAECNEAYEHTQGEIFKRETYQNADPEVQRAFRDVFLSRNLVIHLRGLVDLPSISAGLCRKVQYTRGRLAWLGERLGVEVALPPARACDSPVLPFATHVLPPLPPRQEPPVYWSGWPRARTDQGWEAELYLKEITPNQDPNWDRRRVLLAGSEASRARFRLDHTGMQWTLLPYAAVNDSDSDGLHWGENIAWITQCDDKTRGCQVRTHDHRCVGSGCAADAQNPGGMLDPLGWKAASVAMPDGASWFFGFESEGDTLWTFGFGTDKTLQRHTLAWGAGAFSATEAISPPFSGAYTSHTVALLPKGQRLLMVGEAGKQPLLHTVLFSAGAPPMHDQVPATEALSKLGNAPICHTNGEHIWLLAEDVGQLLYRPNPPAPWRVVDTMPPELTQSAALLCQEGAAALVAFSGVSSDKALLHTRCEADSGCKDRTRTDLNNQYFSNAFYTHDTITKQKIILIGLNGALLFEVDLSGVQMKDIILAPRANLSSLSLSILQFDGETFMRRDRF